MFELHTDGGRLNEVTESDNINKNSPSIMESAPERSAESCESILRASNTSKSVLLTWIRLFTTPVLDVVTAWRSQVELGQEDKYSN